LLEYNRISITDSSASDTTTLPSIIITKPGNECREPGMGTDIDAVVLKLMAFNSEGCGEQRKKGTPRDQKLQILSRDEVYRL
jgi:hypothetical protein